MHHLGAPPTQTRRARRTGAVHLVEDFVAPSTPWLADLVQALGEDSDRVICRRVAGVGLDVSTAVEPLLRRDRPGLRRAGQEVARRLTRNGRAINPYRATLSRLVPRTGELVVHAHFGPMGWYAVDAGLAPVVTSFYGYDASNEDVVRTFRNAYDDLFARGEAFLAEGPRMRDRLERLGAPADRIRLLPVVCAISSEQAQPPAQTAQPRVLMAGRHVEKKGFDAGLEAFAAAHQLVPGAKLTIMGDGPLNAQLHQAATDLGVDQLVRWVPFGPRADYLRVLRECDIFLQPSRTAANGDSEGGAPTTLLDAQALARVVVATNHADIPFVSAPENRHHLTDENDVQALSSQLAHAMTHPQEWPQRALAGRAHVLNQHSPNAVAARAREIYDEVLARPDGGGTTS